ncbi:Gfo/Idh/MocA family protein [Sphingomonas sp. OK281]|uniref:Gfo/Idh/MocA family protein n=1 Tax=Sphingomonas sp. OK281 TaxID=1881067 RepID=UPI0008E8514E|nr:Gfo/Idh/MocA family oxidoreductase [Sphingomonas sp. OK281]SFO28466.1 Predicted dehydrogenase [Sphingomonas sp. OK281]
MSAVSTITSALGLGKKKVRYAIVGLGDISQASMMPGVAHTGNSDITALVTDDAEKARALGKMYGVEATYRYDQFDELLASGLIDAVYLGTPNWRHAEFAIPALRAGVHVLSEKPLEISVEKAEAIRDAERASSAKLMTAYRLHFEPSTLDAIRRIRAGELGELVAFTSCFTQKVDPANHRVKNGIIAGPLFDMAPYPINATRYLFGAEPIEVVSAVATRHPEAGLGDLDDTFAVTLRFPGNRLAQFTVSYSANNVDSLTISGTKGSIHMDPAYGFGDAMEQRVTIGEKKSHESFKPTDQFGGEMRYFSDCILEDRDPEPDAEEGLADLRVIEGVLEALKTGRAVTLPPFQRSRRISADQEQTLSPVKEPKLVHAASPTG